MAFGFGFNKQKVLSAAEKFVQQGKLQNAIAEYEKILKNDPKDLTVTNTVGDLYARLGESARAVECFKTVGDAYATQGFTVKAIAMYKKITKLQPSVDGSLKLAELYTQQGLFNDARAQYLQVAEDFMKSGDLEQAVRLFQKVLEMDPDNVSMRVKLAEVYIRLGKKTDAWQLFSAAAESLRARGSLAAAEDILQRMLSLDPGNSYALLLRGRAAMENDDPKKAIQYLEKAADLDSHPDGLRDLLKAHLQTGQLSQAGVIAEKLMSVHNDPEALFLLADGYAQAGQYHPALDVYARNADRLLAADSARLMTSLHSIIGHVRDDVGALDMLLQLLNKAGESTHIGEVTELLAHACVKDGDFARARDLYQMLATMEPQNPLHMQNYNQVLARAEGAPVARMITAEEGAVIVDELEATAPTIDQTYSDEVAVAVRSALTDADLFLSYNLPEKAIVPLLGALPQAPRDVRLNQRLAALHTRSQRFTEAAVCCRTLEAAYSESGYPEEALRYGELAGRYEERASAVVVVVPPPVSKARATTPVTAPIPAAVPATPWPSTPAPEEHPTPVVEAQPAAPEPQEFAIEAPAVAHDSVDLSSEWADSVSVEAPESHTAAPQEEPAPAAPVYSASSADIAEIVEETRFYLQHFMTEQARAAFAKLESLTQDHGVLDPLRAEIDAAANAPVSEAEPEIAEVMEQEVPPATPEFEVEVASQEAAPEHEIADPGHAAPPAEEHESAPAAAAHPAEEGDLAALVADLEASLGDFPEPASAEPLPAWPKAAPPASEPTPAVAKKSVPEPAFAHAAAAPESVSPTPEAMPAAAASAAAATAPSLSYGPAPVRPLGAGAQAMHPQAGVDLSEMFGELKQELEEEATAGDDDPETHYSLGVAFREMGLLDEAITELQKVCVAVERGHAFPQLVQTYTWLAQCFLDKGVPEAAIGWYEKALTIPGLEAESRIAIHYELGAACETAHKKDAALSHFTQVYGANIDYRDVAERIQALKS